MKNIIYIVMFFGIATISCEPLEDTYNELDVDPNIIENNAIVGDVEYTLTSEDYAALDPTTDEDNFEKFENISIEDAKALIPALLSDKYPVWGNKSSALVTFNFFNRNKISGETTIYEVTEADYNTQGGNIERFGNFSNLKEIATFLSGKYPDAKRGNLIELTYMVRVNGVTISETSTFFLTNKDEWSQTIILTSDDYTALGQGFPNFSSEETAEFRIGIYLKTLLSFAQIGDDAFPIYTYSFRDDDGERQEEDILLTYNFDGDTWNLIPSVVEEVIKFGVKNNKWIADNTIKYTMVTDDYKFVTAQFKDVAGFEIAAPNVENFSNFDRREGRDTFWSNEMILAVVNALLKNNNPTAEVGQQFVVSYNIFDGSDGINDISVILDESGEYMLNK